MLKIIIANFHLYRNEAHYEFMVVYRGKLIAFHVVYRLVESLVTEFDELLDMESKLVDAQKKSAYTIQIADADKLNDKLIVGVREIISAYLKHYDPVIVAAATRLYDRMKSFGRIESKSYEEEAAAISILLADLLSPAFASDIILLNLNSWLMQLNVSVDNFKNLLQERNDAIAITFTTEKLKDVRKNIDIVYRKMTTKINAAAELDESGQYKLFIDQLNAEIRYFNEHTHRAARKDIAEGDHTIIEPMQIQIYTGEAITPIPIVYYQEEGKPAVKLTFAEDFTLSYKNNRKPGMAIITIRGKGAYKGKISTTFNIVEAR
jgi:hypothetical protein